MKNIKPLDDLELFELLQAAYPEKFGDDDDTWDAAHEFIDEIGDSRAIADFGALSERAASNHPAAFGRH